MFVLFTGVSVGRVLVWLVHCAYVCSLVCLRACLVMVWFVCVALCARWLVVSLFDWLTVCLVCPMFV